MAEVLMDVALAAQAGGAFAVAQHLTAMAQVWPPLVPVYPPTCGWIK
jgi:hypothetical protein